MNQKREEVSTWGCRVNEMDSGLWSQAGRYVSAPASQRTLTWRPGCGSSPRSFLGSCYPDRRSMGSSANVPRTVLCAHFHCVDCEKGSWAAARWQRDPTLCTTRVWHPHHSLPGRQLLPAGTGICYPSQAPAASCPQEQLLPSAPTRLETAFLCCKFSPTPSQVTVDVDLLLISNLGSNHLW